ncbi:hypothetical protein K438DRAFT_1755541 [Mycena galopus ATCC 62051]|nr:hypothetical protein K438DRAFT_1755541 [Mycena galopus ATCC 62051]
MPRMPTATEMRLDNITACLTQALPLLTELHDAFGPPFVQPIVNTMQALINLVQNVKQNKNECAQVMENIHRIVYAIINLHIKSETVGSLSPSMLDDVGKFMDFVEAQQEGNKIKHLFGNKETKKLLQDCCAGLTQAMDVFGIPRWVETLNDIREFKDTANLMHKELVKLIETLSDTSTLSSERSSVHWGVNESINSSNSFSLLPSNPKIFHGREQELEIVLKLLSQKSPRIAILGGGGMGKTSLARAALHHPCTTSKFEHRFFVSAEAASTSIELAALVGLHLGLNPGRDLTKAIIQYLSRKPACLLILDNLETVWEPIQTRAGIENLLSLLSEVEHLALMITMRGAERPAKVQWTHPFLSPLQPLSDDAAKQTFMEITDHSYTFEEAKELLQFTDNMPLAVDLIAHLTECEGMSNVLVRWETEKTSMLSMGFDRRSSLDVSIGLSLSSPRITPESKELLSLLSILPNGLSEAELIQSKLGVPNVLLCKAALQATSLVYRDGNRRLMVLMPVREYVQQFLPPSQSHIQSIQKHFHTLLGLFKKHQGEQLKPVITQITMNLANLHEVLKTGLQDSDSNLEDTINSILSLNSFFRLTRRHFTPLIYDIPGSLSQLYDGRLEIIWFIEVLVTASYTKPVLQKAITQATSYFHHIHDPLLESQFYEAVALHISLRTGDFNQATQYLQMAQELSELCGDTGQQCRVLFSLSRLKCYTGDHCAAQVLAQRVSKLSGDLYIEAGASRLEATCSRMRGDYWKSVAQLSRARDLIFLCGLSGGDLDHNSTLEQAEIHLLQSEYAEARSLFNTELENTSPEENATFHAHALLNIALIDIAIGGPKEHIYHNLDTARAIWSKETYAGISSCHMLQGQMEFLEGKFDSASTKFQECLASARGHNEPKSFCLEQLANIRAWPENEGQYKWLVMYLGYAYTLKQKLALHKAFLFLGDVFITNEDEKTATSLYQVALEGFTYMGVHQSRAQCMLRLGDLANKNGHISEAMSFWKAARPLFERSSQAKDMAQIDAKIATVENAHQMTLVQLETLDAPVQEVDEDDNKHSVQEGAKEHTVPVSV